MRKMKSKRTGSRKSMRRAKSVEEYIVGIPEASRTTFMKLRETARLAAPRDAVETISYGIPALRTDRVLVWYAAFAKHCSLFPTGEVIEQFKDELHGYKITKGTVQFPLDEPIPTALIKRIVKTRALRAKSAS